MVNTCYDYPNYIETSSKCVLDHLMKAIKLLFYRLQTINIGIFNQRFGLASVLPVW